MSKAPLPYMRRVAEINRRQREEMRAADEERRKKAAREAAAKAAALRAARLGKMAEDSSKVRVSIPRNAETDANMAKTEEMLRIKRERR